MAPFRPDISPGGRRGSVELVLWGVWQVGGVEEEAEEGWAMTGALW